MCMSLINANTLNGRSTLLPVWNPIKLTSSHLGLCPKRSRYLFAFRGDSENQEMKSDARMAPGGCSTRTLRRAAGLSHELRNQHTISRKLPKATPLPRNAPSTPAAQLPTASDHRPSSHRRTASLTLLNGTGNQLHAFLG